MLFYEPNHKGNVGSREGLEPKTSVSVLKSKHMVGRGECEGQSGDCAGRGWITIRTWMN